MSNFIINAKMLTTKKGIQNWNTLVDVERKSHSVSNNYQNLRAFRKANSRYEVQINNELTNPLLLWYPLVLRTASFYIGWL